jgi:hypothetical protein
LSASVLLSFLRCAAIIDTKDLSVIIISLLLLV